MDKRKGTPVGGEIRWREEGHRKRRIHPEPEEYKTGRAQGQEGPSRKTSWYAKTSRENTTNFHEDPEERGRYPTFNLRSIKAEGWRRRAYQESDNYTLAPRAIKVRDTQSMLTHSVSPANMGSKNHRA
jgi:hypothetical protein